MSERNQNAKSEVDSVYELERVERKRAMELLKELAHVTEMEKVYKERGDEIKLSLEKIQRGQNLNGLRHERLVFIAKDMPGKRMLDRGLLIENGVVPSIIEASMKTSKSYVERRFKVIGATEGNEREESLKD